MFRSMDMKILSGRKGGPGPQKSRTASSLPARTSARRSWRRSAASGRTRSAPRRYARASSSVPRSTVTSTSKPAIGPLQRFEFVLVQQVGGRPRAVQEKHATVIVAMVQHVIDGRTQRRQADAAASEHHVVTAADGHGPGGSVGSAARRSGRRLSCAPTATAPTSLATRIAWPSVPRRSGSELTEIRDLLLKNSWKSTLNWGRRWGHRCLSCGNCTWSAQLASAATWRSLRPAGPARAARTYLGLGFTAEHSYMNSGTVRKATRPATASG